MQQIVEAVPLPILLVLPALSQATYGFGRGVEGLDPLYPVGAISVP